MPRVPSSGQINVKGIFSELNEDDYTAQNIDGETNVSFTKLTNGTYATINTSDGWDDPNNTSGQTGANIAAQPHSLSEWRGYNHSFTSFSWPTPVGGFAYAPSSMYTSEDIDNNGNTAIAGTQIQLTFNSNGSHVHSVKDYTASSGGIYSTGGSFSSSGTPTILEARWVIVDGDFTMSGGTADKIQVGYVPGGSIGSTSVNVRLGNNGNATDTDFTDSYRTITPAVFGGSGSNTQTFSIQATAQSSNYPGDQAKVATNASGDYVGLQIRANQDDSKTVTFRSGLTTNVDIDAISFETPGFTCIMPDMLVSKRYVNSDNEYIGRLVRIGDIEVGDYILAQGDLNDPSVQSQWAEVTEARTHTREGYWNVEGLHITNDHPIWLTNESGSAWVKVEDINNPGSIERTYVEGTVDPVYLGTTPGHYYVYANDQKFTVSGDYAPTTE